MAYNVDLDLFIKATSQGLKDGAALGTGFSNFVEGFTKGIDDQQKYETQEQEQVIRQNQIEQLPVTNRIQEATADTADMQLAAYRADPESYTEGAVAKQQVAAQLEIQKQNFLNVITTGDGAQKAEAIMGGQFNDLFAFEPDLKTAATKQTFTEWPEESKSVYKENQSRMREQELLQEVQDQIKKSYIKTSEAYFGSDTIQALASQADASVAQLVEKGEIRTITVPSEGELIRKTEPVDPKTGADYVYSNGQKVPWNPDPNDPYVKDENGNYLRGAPKDDKGRTIQAFFYNGKRIGETSGLEIDSDTSKIFNNYKRDYTYTRRQMPGQDGDTDLYRRDKKITEQKAAAAAESQAQTSLAQDQSQAMQTKFFEGAKISPQYQEAASNFKSTVEQNNAAAPQLYTPVEGGVEVKAGQFDVTKPNPVTMPNSFDPTKSNPVDMSSTALATDPTAPKALRTQLQQQMARAKAIEIQNRIKPPKEGEPAPIVKAQVDSAGRTSPQSAPLPATFKVNSDIPDLAPNVEGIKRVQERPEVQGFPALAKAVMVQESAGKASANSPTGVKGLMQVTEGTAKEIAGQVNREDPVTSAMLGGIYLEKQLSNPAFGNNPMLALTAYNAGPEAVRRAIELAGSTEWYAVKRQLPAAIRSMDSYWKSIGVKTEQKIRESTQYAEKVVANFSAMVKTPDDMRMANLLKQQQVLVF